MRHHAVFTSWVSLRGHSASMALTVSAACRHNILCDVWFTACLFTLGEPVRRCNLSSHRPRLSYVSGRSCLKGWSVGLGAGRSRVEHKQEVCWWFIRSAVTWCTVAIACIPLTTAQLVYGVWLYGEFLCKASTYLQGTPPVMTSNGITDVFTATDKQLINCHHV